MSGNNSYIEEVLGVRLPKPSEFRQFIEESIYGGINPKEYSVIKNRISWFLLYRLLTLTFFVVSAGKIYFTGLDFVFDFLKIENGHYQTVFIFIGFAYLLSLINALLIKYTEDIVIISFGHFILDILFATAIVLITKTPISIILYLVIITASSTVLNRFGSIFIAMICGISYFSITLMLDVDSFGVTSLESFAVYMSLVLIAAVLSEFNKRVALIKKDLETSGKKIEEKEQILNFVTRDLEKYKSSLELHESLSRRLREDDLKVVVKDQLVGNSDLVKKVSLLTDKAAKSEDPVFICGERGTGKELVARTIHSKSKRADSPFIYLDCEEYESDQIDKVLFGTDKEKGVIDLVEQGTLFINDISRLPLTTQSKLLHYMDLMASTVYEKDKFPRLITATHKDLRAEISNEHFKERLFYRINSLTINIPPLRHRKSDIPDLIRSFLPKSESVPEISPESLNLLLNYSYPGNVRELKNLIEQLVALETRSIVPEDLPDNVRAEALTNITSTFQTAVIVLPIDLEKELGTIEKRILQKALIESNGVKKKAADLLNLNFRSLRYRLKKYELADDSD